MGQTRMKKGLPKIGLVMSIYVLALSPAKGYSQSVPGCGNLHNAYGPYDYTNPDDFANKLPIVESAHFRPETERLEWHTLKHRNPAGDIDYTLRAFPNHHRALQAMAKYALQSNQSPPPHMHYSAECWFERAIAFQPADGVVRMLYGTYLFKKRDLDGALREYQVAEELMGDNPELDYNLGLLHFKREEYDRAYNYARKAYDEGFPLPGLKKMLKSVGHWPEGHGNGKKK
jgi:tetratricopeptide (TPR) repeat protein